MKVPANEYLDKRGSQKTGTLTPEFLDAEMEGHVRYESTTKLVLISPQVITVLRHFTPAW